jgi:hypothetical protein
MIDIVEDNKGHPHKKVIFMGFSISEDELAEMADEMGYRLVEKEGE